MSASGLRSTLPPLSAEEERHSRALAAHMRAELLCAGGWLSFERFMELALYTPGLGYYSAGSAKIGPGGDLVTAPEVSALFGRCLARQCAEILEHTGGEILELGAGTGRMAAELLGALAALGVTLERYAILEVSADLAERQRRRLAGLPPALPERGVWLERLGETLPDGYASEVSLRLGPWIASLGECLGRGVLLLADYGLPRRHYYHPERAGGTLRCHFKQRAHDDPYINLGVQDITAWVDFTRVAEAAAAADLTVGGFATQAAFLLALGLEGLVAQADDTVQRARLAGEARRLIMPEEMGEAFKFMALTRGYDAPLSGFALQDLSRLL